MILIYQVVLTVIFIYTMFETIFIGEWTLDTMIELVMFILCFCLLE